MKSFTRALVIVLALVSPATAQTALPYPPLPKPPQGWTVREVAQLPVQSIRLASDGAGKTLYCLGMDGDLFRIDIASGQITKLAAREDYLVHKPVQALGLWLAPTNRLYIATNFQDDSVDPGICRVIIYRTDSIAGAKPTKPTSWLVTQYPYGIHTFNHGVNHMALGPDGMLYASSGSRTDHGEASDVPHRSKAGETPITACTWRLDWKSDKPHVEVWARGLRNSFGFCFDDRGRMFATENGPNEDAPEELNFVEKDKHYGFPFFFSTIGKMYPDQPSAPAGLQMTQPVINEGPAAGGSKEKPISTFDPHSSPSGIVYLGNSFPEKDRGIFLAARYGNFIGPADVGFDVLQIRVREEGESLKAQVTPFLTPVSRPIDLHLSGGKVYLLEYDRQTTRAGSMADPGRILELTPTR